MTAPDLDAALRSGPNPFEDRVVHSTSRGDVPDAQEIHGAVRERVRRAIDTAATKGLGSFLVINGQVGRGKTHLLSRIRAESADRNYSFIEVEPLRDAETPLLHVLRYVGASLRAPDSAPWQAMHTPIERAFYESLLTACVNRVKSGIVPAHPAIVALFEEARSITPDLLGVDRFALRCAEAWPQIEQPLRAELVSTPPFKGCDAAILQILFRLPSTRRTDLVSAYLSAESLAPEDLELIGARDPIDTEDEAWRVLKTLLPLGRQAVVLAFDQLESAVDSVGIQAVRKLFIKLSDLRDRGGPVVVLASCQSQVWQDIRDGLPAQVQDRVDAELPLQAPLRAEALALVTVRLAALGFSRPHPLYPFAPNVIEEIYAEGEPPGPRGFFKKLAARWEAWRSTKPVVAPGAPPPPDPPTPPPPPAKLLRGEVIHAAIEEHVKNLRPRDIPRRSERVRILLDQALAEAQKTKQAVSGVQVHSSQVWRPSPTSSATGLELELERDGKRRKVRIEVNDEPHGNSPRYGLTRLVDSIAAKTADAAFLLRREDQALTTEVTRALTERLGNSGGAVIYVKDAAAVRAEANLRVIDEAAAGGLPDGINRSETLRHVLQAELPNLEAWTTIVSRTFGAASAVVAAAPTPALPPEGAAPSERVLQLLSEGQRVMTESRLEQSLKLDQSSLAKTLEELVVRGEVQRFKDKQGDAMVMLTARRP